MNIFKIKTCNSDLILDLDRDISRSVAEVKKCGLKNVANLPFNFDRGTCASVLNDTPKALLCFDYNENYACHM